MTGASGAATLMTVGARDYDCGHPINTPPPSSTTQASQRRINALHQVRLVLAGGDPSTKPARMRKGTNQHKRPGSPRGVPKFQPTPTGTPHPADGPLVSWSQFLPDPRRRQNRRVGRSASCPPGAGSFPAFGSPRSGRPRSPAGTGNCPPRRSNRPGGGYNELKALVYNRARGSQRPTARSHHRRAGKPTLTRSGPVNQPLVPEANTPPPKWPCVL